MHNVGGNTFAQQRAGRSKSRKSYGNERSCHQHFLQNNIKMMTMTWMVMMIIMILIVVVDYGDLDNDHDNVMMIMMMIMLINIFITDAMTMTTMIHHWNTLGLL